MKTIAASVATFSPKLLPGLGAIFLGLAVILGVGFLQDANSYLHNAAHDSRHSAAFPCH
ncbi:MAG: CbtB domain-containing protein [Methylomonas sp.]|jgi:cobalt transporter subunit CbtB